MKNLAKFYDYIIYILNKELPYHFLNDDSNHVKFMSVSYYKVSNYSFIFKSHFFCQINFDVIVNFIINHVKLK